MKDPIKINCLEEQNIIFVEQNRLKDIKIDCLEQFLKVHNRSMADKAYKSLIKATKSFVELVAGK